MEPFKEFQNAGRDPEQDVAAFGNLGVSQAARGIEDHPLAGADHNAVCAPLPESTFFIV